MIYELYGKAHKSAKRLLKKTSAINYRMVSVKNKNISVDNTLIIDGKTENSFFNDSSSIKELKKENVYPLENIVPVSGFYTYDDSFSVIKKPSEKELGVLPKEAEKSWKSFISHSVIPDGFRYSGLHYAGYILDCDSWCLPSWLWTNAAIVRMYCKTGNIEKAKHLSDKLISLQKACGGWVVRNDYDKKGAIPVLAPNDSAYTANNGCLEVFLATGEKKYLDSAIKCADWIIETARDDGMVYVGYDTRENRWQTKHNIVDVGFTAGLFARLFETTKDEKYLVFLKRFVNKYIKLFYNPLAKGFATSLDAEEKQIGGLFGRGQAWALEGLIPAYRVLKTDNLHKVITDTISTILKRQNSKGGWAYNFSRPLMGVDCKATPILALALLNWSREYRGVAQKALKWCEAHTSHTSNSKGGIFSYTTEGAIVHHMYTWTAFVYASAYAIELKQLIENR